MKRVGESRLIDADLKRRIRRVQFTQTPFEAWVFVETLKALPDDTVVAGVSADDRTYCWNLFVMSDKFSPIDEGSEVPIIQVTMDALKKEVKLTIHIGPESFLDNLSGL